MKWDWNCVRGIFWGTLIVLAFFALFWWWKPIRMTVYPLPLDCRYTSDCRYEIYTDQWRTIPLGVGPNGQEGIWMSHGTPVPRDTYNEEEIKKLKLKYFKKVSNGNFVVIKGSRTQPEGITVWSPELMDFWKQHHWNSDYRFVNYCSEQGCKADRP